MKIFSRKSRTKGNEADNHVPEKLTPEEAKKTSPFIAGMNEYMERYGHQSRQVTTWRKISLVMTLLCIGCVAWVIAKAGETNHIPFIVEVDRHGYEIAIKPVQPSGIDDRLIISRLGRFITNLRTVMNDDMAQVTYIDFAYKSVPPNSGAHKKVMEFYRNNNPLHIGQNEKTSILVHLKSILPLGDSGKTWRGEWDEQRILKGEVVETKNYNGIFEITINPPTKMQEVFDNPMGLFVVDFNITEELKKR